MGLSITGKINAKPNADRIIMKEMEFFSRIGVLSFEKEQGQVFILDVTFVCNSIQACITDRLDQTIDYSAAYSAIQNYMETATCDLIEKAAGDLAEILLDLFPQAAEVTVLIRKPNAPIKGIFAFMGVEITRSSNH